MANTILNEGKFLVNYVLQEYWVIYQTTSNKLILRVIDYKSSILFIHKQLILLLAPAIVYSQYNIENIRLLCCIICV